MGRAIWTRGNKTFFMLNLVEHEILIAHKYKNIKKFCFNLGSGKPRMLFFTLINVKMPTIVGILTFMSKQNFMLSWVEHEKSFITSGPGLVFCSVTLAVDSRPLFASNSGFKII